MLDSNAQREAQKFTENRKPTILFFLYAEIQKGILYIKKNMTNKNTKQMLQFIGRQIICCWDRNLQ